MFHVELFVIHHGIGVMKTENTIYFCDLRALVLPLGVSLLVMLRVKPPM